MTTQRALITPRPLPGFTLEERLALRILRKRYQQGQDLFSAPELAHLRFLRWLHATRRIVP